MGMHHHAPGLSQGVDSQKGQEGAKCDAMLEMYVPIQDPVHEPTVLGFILSVMEEMWGKYLIKHGSDCRAGLKLKKAHAGYITNYSDSENIKTKPVCDIGHGDKIKPRNI